MPSATRFSDYIQDMADYRDALDWYGEATFHSDVTIIEEDDYPTLRIESGDGEYPIIELARGDILARIMNAAGLRFEYFGNTLLILDTLGAKIPDGLCLDCEEVHARDSDGLKLHDDGGAGLKIEDGGDALFDGDIKLLTGKGITHADSVGVGEVLICDGTRFIPASLPGDFTGFANPTAQVGLSVVNGSATTAMRSDGAPPLDVSIVPTWTGIHTFSDDVHLGTGKGVVHADGVAAGKVLIADGTRYVPADLPGSFTGFANPTASVGLSAVNGVATTAMRSDAAPALDQGIAPTWTANHTFNENILQAAAKYISTAEVRAQGGAGLKLHDDGGNGLIIEDGGYAGFGVADPEAPVHVYRGTAGTVLLLEISGDANTPLVFESNALDKVWMGYHAGEDCFKVSHGEAGVTAAADQLVLKEGRLGVLVDAPAGQAHIDQLSTTGAIPVLVLDQADIDQPIVKIIGTAEVGSADRSLVAASDFTTPGAIIAWEMVYAEDIGNRFPDAKYWRPLYAMPTA